MRASRSQFMHAVFLCLAGVPLGGCRPTPAPADTAGPQPVTQEIPIHPATYSTSRRAGAFAHQVGWRTDGRLYGTWTLALFHEEIDFSYFEGPGPDRCANDVGGEPQHGRLDVGPSVEMEVGADRLVATKDTTFEPGEIYYILDREGAQLPGMDAGSPIRAFGVDTGIRVPPRPVFEGGIAYFDNYLASGVLDLTWTPTDEPDDFLFLAIHFAATLGELGTVVCSVTDDGRAIVRPGFAVEEVGSEVELDIRRVHRALVPSTWGPIEMTAFANVTHTRLQPR